MYNRTCLWNTSRNLRFLTLTRDRLLFYLGTQTQSPTFRMINRRRWNLHTRSRFTPDNFSRFTPRATWPTDPLFLNGKSIYRYSQVHVHATRCFSHHSINPSDTSNSIDRPFLYSLRNRSYFRLSVKVLDAKVRTINSMNITIFIDRLV